MRVWSFARLLSVCVLLACCFLSPNSVLAAEEITCGPHYSVDRSTLVHGRFTYAREGSRMLPKIPLEGRFTFAVGKGSIWYVEKPMPVTFVWTRAGLIQYVGGQAFPYTALKENPYNNRISSFIEGAMTGLWGASGAREDFNITCEGGLVNWNVAVIPKKGGRGEKYLKSLFLTGWRTPSKAILWLPHGEIHTLTMSDIIISGEALPPLEDAFFKVQ